MNGNTKSLFVAGIALTTCLGLGMIVRTDSHKPPPFTPGSETIVVIPDTEGYTSRRPQQFIDMMKWVAAQQKARNITYLLHVGDVTNNNTKREWENARKSFDVIEGKLRYVLAAGNHDYDHTPGRLTHMNDYFKVAELKKWSTFGDVYEKGKLENHYQLMKIQGRDWIVLSLEMGPRKKVIEWANNVLAKHKNRLAIILTHGYLYYNNQRYNHLMGRQRATPYNFYGEGADGEQLWNQLVRRHSNVMMVICGHLSAGYVGYRNDEGDYGNAVHQMMVDYENLRGGRGFLRLLEFQPDKKTVQVRTYSPLTGEKNPRDPKLEEFSFRLRFATRTKPVRVDGPSRRLRKPPKHRYRFGEIGGDGTRINDSIGNAHGTLVAEDSQSRLNGKGQLVLKGSGRVDLPSMLKKQNDVSFEVWLTPLSKEYQWHSAVRFGNPNDWLHYCFRNFNTVRAEIAVRRHNEDIQVPSAAVLGKPMHIVVTYDHKANEGKPVLCFYRDGKRYGRLPTNLKLTDVADNQNRIGPFVGQFDELRVYDYALTEEEVRGTHKAGPNKLEVAKSR
ncbi:MAG: LamG-like jellyroll fold domain-containing protein [Gemmataceae bacterium]